MNRGAAVAWVLAIEHPELVNKMIIIDVPHPKVMNDKLRSSLAQVS